MLISQELFDETLLESQELFDYADNDQAVQETISELQSQDKESRLDHLSLTHPDSEQGKKDRANQRNFVQALESEDLSLANAIVINASAATKKDDKNSAKAIIMFASLVLQHGFLQLRSTLMQRFDEPENCASREDHELEMDELVQFLLAILSDSASSSPAQQHALVRELKLQLGRTLLQERWFPVFDKYPLLRLALISLARVCCNGCEANKKTLVQAGIRFQATIIIPQEEMKVPRSEPSCDNEPVTATTAKLNNTTVTSGIGLWIECLPHDLNINSKELMAMELCQLFTVLGKFQTAAESPPGSSDQAPLVSSAHANVKEFYKFGAVQRLHKLAQQALETHPTMSERKRNEREALLCHVLSALRVMAIDNDIVQNMVAVGILETLSTVGTVSHEEEPADRNTTIAASASTDLTLLVHQPNTAAATLGLLRNLCANDEIKSTLCRQSLAPILQAMELHSSNAVVQEHGCGILAAMSLRQPHNATMICRATNGAEAVLKAMRAFPNKVPLQRQACLALRNIASRSNSEDKQMLLDAGAEVVLREIAGRHQESIDEAYAALRDLGCAAVKYTVDDTGKAQGTRHFGAVESNFRPVYD